MTLPDYRIYFTDPLLLVTFSRNTATLASSTTPSSVSPSPPPPLYHSPIFKDRRERESTVDSTSSEVGTPISSTSSDPSLSQRRFFDHHNLISPHTHAGPRDHHHHHNHQDRSDFTLDDLLFLEEEEDDTTHTFSQKSQQPLPTINMAATNSPPIDIATPRGSPPGGQQTSNLTSQLQAARGQQNSMSYKRSPYLEARRGSEMMPESFGNVYGTSFHSRPIAMASSGRRESTALPGSMMGGMSWGGLSVGSFIRDE